MGVDRSQKGILYALGNEAVSYTLPRGGDYFLEDLLPLPFRALLLDRFSLTTLPALVWDLSSPFVLGELLLAVLSLARYFLRSGVAWYAVLYAFFLALASGLLAKYLADLLLPVDLPAFEFLR